MKTFPRHYGGRSWSVPDRARISGRAAARTSQSQPNARSSDRCLSCLLRGSWSPLSLRPAHRAGQPTAGWWRDALIYQIYQLGLRVVVDLALNPSDQHSWFQAALAAKPGTPQRMATANGAAQMPPDSAAWFLPPHDTAVGRLEGTGR